jgi:hypothetical protein
MGVDGRSPVRDNRVDIAWQADLSINQRPRPGQPEPSPPLQPAPAEGRCWSDASTLATLSSSVWSRSVRVLTFTVVVMRGQRCRGPG